MTRNNDIVDVVVVVVVRLTDRSQAGVYIIPRRGQTIAGVAAGAN